MKTHYKLLLLFQSTVYIKILALLIYYAEVFNKIVHFKIHSVISQRNIAFNERNKMKTQFQGKLYYKVS